MYEYLLNKPRTVLATMFHTVPPGWVPLQFTHPKVTNPGGTPVKVDSSVTSNTQWNQDNT